MAKGDLEIRDPRVLRALAHPARLAMLEHLQLNGPATATECAEPGGVTPAAASYHLRILARAGLVEDAGGGNGRERPWRPRVRGFTFETRADASPAEQAAASLLLAQLISRGDRWTADYLANEGALPHVWRQASHIANKTLLLSPDEARKLGEAIDDLCSRFSRSREDAPPGAEDYRVLIRAFPARVRR